MARSFSLKQFSIDVWLLEQLLQAAPPGMTLNELQQRWESNPRHEGVLSRSTMSRHRQDISDCFGVIIQTKDKKHYSIANPEALSLDSLANDLLASVQEYLFLDEYRDLGDAIQPQQIMAGRDYLHPIGDAIRHRRKLKIRYQKYTDEECYDAIIHPYCLKASQNRWYILAVKEGSSHRVQTFALDRTLYLHVLEENYAVDRSIDVKNYFNDAFGVWVDPDHHPVRDITVAVPEWVSKYWRTLPLHPSQKIIGKDGGKVLFHFHISLTPDFIGELKRWDVDVRELIE